MHLNELKVKKVSELVNLAKKLNIDGAANMRRQELIFSILNAQSRAGEDGNIMGEGVLDVLPESFGFLRAPDYSYLPGPDDIYVSPSQIKKFALRTGDLVEGEIRSPKDKERFFALLRVDKVNGGDPDASRGSHRGRASPGAAAPR